MRAVLAIAAQTLLKRLRRRGAPLRRDTRIEMAPDYDFARILREAEEAARNRRSTGGQQ